MANMQPAPTATSTGTPAVPLSTVGQPGGVAQLDSTGVVPDAQVEAAVARVVVHGAVAATARPATATFVHWIGSATPANVATNDEWTDTANKITKRWNGAAFDILGSAASLTTGINPTTHVFDAIGYGAKADAVTRSDGAMSSATNTTHLTSAGAAFTSADVGKVVVVNNAKGAGTHLYGTIASYVSATEVVLSTACTNTVTGAPFSYGTDDWTAIQNAANAAAAARGTLRLAPTPMMITAAITVPEACTVRGVGVQPVFGLDTVTGATTGDLSAQTIPTIAPYLSGSVLVVGAPNVNGVTLASQGNTVNISDVGVYFAGWFKNTGHGFEITAPALSAPAAGFNNGGMSHKWDNLYVYGHDGSHYAYLILNTLEQVCTNINSFGGGGVKLIADSSIAYYGAALFNKFKFIALAGPAHGVYMTANNSSLMNVVQFNQYSAIPAGIYVGSRYAAWGTFTISGDPLHMDSGKAIRVALISADIEYGSLVIPAGTVYISPDSIVSATITGASDPSPYSWQAGHRRVNADASQSLDANETSGSTWWLVNDIGNGANWAVTTDGSVQFLKPGTMRHTGKSPSASVGAALGTTPPPVIISGADSAGRAIFGSGTTPTTGAVASFTFAKTMSLGAVVNVVPLNSATQALGLYVSALSTTGFTVSCAVAPAASQGVSTYAFSWTAEDAATAPAVPAVYESFDKADNASSLGSPQIGSAPTVLAGTWGISSNLGYMSALAGAQQPAVTWNAALADCTIQCTLSTVGAGTGVCFRSSSASSVLYAQNNAVFYYNGTTWTQQGSNFTSTFINGDVMKIVLLGTQVTVFRNGTQVYTQAISQNSTVTNHGLVNGSSTTARWNNFSVSP